MTADPDPMSGPGMPAPPVAQASPGTNGAGRDGAPEVRRLAIIGTGLMGGSFGLVVSKTGEQNVQLRYSF